MALGFMGAFLSYATGFYITRTSNGPDVDRLRAVNRVVS